MLFWAFKRFGLVHNYKESEIRAKDGNPTYFGNPLMLVLIFVSFRIDLIIKYICAQYHVAGYCQL